jgi:hypothetical protein
VRREREDVDVVVFKMLDAPPRRRRRPKRISEAPEAEPVRTARVTVVAGEDFDDEAAAKRWLDRVRRDADERDAEVDGALRTVNRAIHAQRVAAGDPYLSEVASDRALQVRLGYGLGEQVVEGHWSEAFALPTPRRSRRRQMLAPQEQLAGMLSGRSRAYASEDLALRARADLDQRRFRQAALQLQVAARALGAEGSESGSHAGAQPVALPGDRNAAIDELAAEALAGELEEAQVSLLGEVLSELEKLLRRRRGREL